MNQFGTGDFLAGEKDSIAAAVDADDMNGEAGAGVGKK